MTYIPTVTHPKWAPPAPQSTAPYAITVHALKENKRPVGFAPCPKPKRQRKSA